MTTFRQYVLFREASISVLDPHGVEVKFSPRYPNKAYQLITVNPQKILPYWQANKLNYVEPGHENEIGGRIEGFATWYHGGQPYHRQQKAVEPSRVMFRYPKSMREKYPDDPRVWVVDFSDGRHRFAWMVQQGFKKIPIQVERQDAEDFIEKFGT